ncbi:MAG TPA: NAD(P)-dependent oxidoreductase [Anaerohalosphaeraceae bacterium]|nr:NAD(P)-dependent oxidoreductase [Anaerohalosphaeraceae bacterium]HOM76266.1 NAD(P)-dependent oxidoreductase [Anaerohalosphaeraceae bacterium]HPC64313.1 NAD(P)-dependent oxidoreductase [Anaerohalosphaeraceae bacterium]HPO70507.1 NAD(P)-dependent oxidoreductase [Anaerohalosphaeraceae bacterium]HRS71563.1 NAD(P)-dependent oxidoreductase [Anaerohalosphaeraceae bacterium]
MLICQSVYGTIQPFTSAGQSIIADSVRVFVWGAGLVCRQYARIDERDGMKEQIAYIGMGIMGAPMAVNLLNGGYSVVVHTRTPQKAQPVLDRGARWADSPAEAARHADVVITCLPDTPDVQKVLLGENGVIETARRGTVCIDMSTISPQITQQIAAALAQKGLVMLDAPVSGGQSGAVEAKLSIMVGGPKEAFERVRPILACLGRAITHCGPAGFGQLTKLANQVMVIHTIVSIAEGLAFAEQAGLDLQTTWEAACSGAAYSHSLKVLGAKILAGDMKPAFKAVLQLKDLRLVMETARQIGQPLPATALAAELLSVLPAIGRGEDGTQALIDVIRHLRMPKESRTES